MADPSGIAGTYAIDAIKDAIFKLSAESRIRDLDMAKEMVEYSKNNILAQAGQSMLAQANQSTQGVLSLLGSSARQETSGF